MAQASSFLKISLTAATMAKSFDTNVKGLPFTVQKSLPLLQDRGSIILTAATGPSLLILMPQDFAE